MIGLLRHAFTIWQQRHDRGCWRGGALVCHQFNDGGVGFVTDGGDHRCSSTEHRVRHDSLIKCPQVFQASAAAGDDHCINSQLIGTPIDGVNGTGDRGRGGIALHGNINHQNAHERRS